jgi:uncharacterized protein
MSTPVRSDESTPLLPEVVAATPPAWPAPPAGRLPALDLLRGFAILGILPANMPIFSGTSPLTGPFNPAPPPETGANLVVKLLTLVFVDGKMITLLSMLFGAGLALQADRAWSAGRRFTPGYLVRMLVLFVIGVLHGTLIWFGDILAMYSIIGVAAVLFVRFWKKGLWITLAIFLGVTWLMLLGFGTLEWATYEPKAERVLESVPEWRQLGTLAADKSLAADEKGKKIKRWFEDYASDANQKRIFREGTYGEQVASRLLFFGISLLTVIPIFGGQLLAGFLLGALLVRRGLFSDLAGTRPLRRRLIVIGLAVGVPLHTAAAILAAVGGGPGLFGATAVQPVAAPFFSLLYLGLLLTWLESGRLRWLQQRLRAVGQIALTNYLMQSVLSTLVFYSIGFGLFGTTGRPETLLVVAAIWALELLWSPLYLRRFQIGPVEWLWRSLAERKRRPLLRATA